MSNNNLNSKKTLAWTGERYIPELRGQIEIEHIHRYLLAKLLSSGKRVLDIASGEGYGSAMLAETAKSVVGVDISQEAVTHATAKYHIDNLKFKVGSCSSIPLEDSSIDMIVSFETIEHHNEHDQMMREFKRILVPNGIVIISSPDKYEYSDRTNYNNPYHVKELYRNEFESLLKTYFKNHKILDQKVVYGSYIFGNNISKKTISYRLSEGKLSEEFSGLPMPIYLIAIASDSDLSPIQNNLLEGNVEFSDNVKVRDEKITILQNKCDKQLAQISERDKQIINLDQSISERDKQIAALNKLIRESNERLEVVFSSKSWKITKPLRWCNKQLHRFVTTFKLVRRVTLVKGGLLPLIKNIIRIMRKDGLAGLKSRFVNISMYLSTHTRKAPLPLEKSFKHTDVIVNASSKPVVSIIIPIYGKCDYTYRCLASITANQPSVPFEVIVIDDNSPDVSTNGLNKVNGIRFISNTKNQGFIRSCNIGAKLAIGKYLYFLNNDTIVTAGWLDELVRTFHEFPDTGLVGSKLIYPDGTLQEAGGIIWQDGSAWNFGRNQDPMLPVFNYAREVDYCSGASIMAPKTLFEELGGFDEHYLPAYCEDSDLALKIRDKGYRVIYQPLSTVIHYEGVTSGTNTSAGVKSYQVENNKKLFERWKSCLKNHQPSGIDVDNAKDRCMAHRVLVLEHCTPTPDRDAGSVTVFNFMLLLREMGFQITFIPEDNFCYLPEYTTALQRVGVEVLYAPYVTSVVQHVKNFGERYELAFLFRPGVAERHLDTIRKYCKKAKVLYYAHDLHFLRMMREADLFADTTKQCVAEEMKVRELKAISSCDASIVVTEVELKTLKAYIPIDNVYIFPLILSSQSTHKKFSDRKDIIFFGGFQHTPNIDAVHYFVEKIMPFLRIYLPGVCFYVVGSMVPEKIQALGAKDIIITGFVEDLSPMLDKMRISVAPLRYGAGVKGKVGTSMAAGLPVVATTLAAEGMFLKNNENVLIADEPKEFAAAIAKLYNDEYLWNKLSSNGLKFAEDAWGAETAWDILAKILGDLGLYVSKHTRPLRLYQYYTSDKK